MDIPHVGAGQAGACLMMIAFGVLLPFGSLIVWKIISKKPVAPYFCGWLVFLLFAGVLEGILNYIVLKPTSSGGSAMMSNPPLYTAYGAIVAGVFEETGRLFAFKVMLKKHTDRQTSVMYGLGHGGFEALTVLLIGGVSTLLTILSINSGALKQQLELIAQTNPEQVETYKAAVDQIASMSMMTGFFSVFERIVAMVIHISLSMVMFCAARVKGKGWLYPAAIALHALFDVPAALYQAGVIKELAIVEVAFAVIAVPIFIFAYGVVYKKWMKELIEEEPVIIPMNT